MARTIDQIDLALAVQEKAVPRNAAGINLTLQLLTSTLEGEIQNVLDLVGSRGNPAEAVAPTGMCADLANIVQLLQDLQTSVNALGGATARASSTQTLGPIDDGQSLQTASWSLPGVGPGNLLFLASSVAFPKGVVAVAKYIAPASVLVEIANLSGDVYAPGTATFTVVFL